MGLKITERIGDRRKENAEGAREKRKRDRDIDRATKRPIQEVKQKSRQTNG